jgi:S1-C subfamily serine protease
VDGRDKPGHDDGDGELSERVLTVAYCEEDHRSMQRSPQVRNHEARAWLVAIGLFLMSVPPAAAATATGTAFAVSGDGSLVTNEHVVAGCTTVKVRQGAQELSATVVASDHLDDLALVRLPQGSRPFARIRRGPAVRLGEQIVAFGFPLSGALTTEGNLTVGYVSALRGVRNDEKRIQITAQVQPGNSGGPLVDTSGNIVGVVSSQLDAIKVLRATGEVPQNVNFAVALDRLKRFLESNKVATAEEVSAGELRPADIADQMQKYSFLIECKQAAVANAASPQPPPDRGSPPSPRAADGCAQEIVAAKQLLQIAGAGVREALAGPAAARCGALHRFYSAMITSRVVVGRCDASDLREAHTAELSASIDHFKQRMPPDCAP